MKDSLTAQIIEAIASVIGNNDAALHEPRFDGHEWQYVKECLDSGWVSSVGGYVDQFEDKLAQFCGSKHAVAMVNGTAALHLALQLAGVRRGDEVLLPALTFVATANAVSYLGATPHFVDSDERRLGIDVTALGAYLADIVEMRQGQAINRVTDAPLRAIVPMHTFGHPVAMDDLLELADKYNLPIVEDAAEGLGSYYRGTHVGNLGRLAALSFNGNKIITTGGGGALLTNDAELAQQAKHLSTTARRHMGRQFYHDQIGYNYRMPNINAALGCAQLEQLPDFLRCKRKLAGKYRMAFAHIDEVRFCREPEDSQSNYWLNTLRLLDGDHALRDAILDAAEANGWQCRPVWKLMNELPMFENCPRMPLTNAQRLSETLINLPSSVSLGDSNDA